MCYKSHRIKWDDMLEKCFINHPKHVNNIVFISGISVTNIFFFFDGGKKEGPWKKDNLKEFSNTKIKIKTNIKIWTLVINA